MTQKKYAGIGSRSTPAKVGTLMQNIARVMEKEQWVLRSGGADGADSYFEAGVSDPVNKEIYLPSASFNGHSAKDAGMYDSSSLPAFPEALKTVDRYHPAPQRLSAFARKLMARNAMQVLGPDLQTPSCFVIAWTSDGKLKGGTSQAIRIAVDNAIPVFNLGIPENLTSLAEWVDSGCNTEARTFQDLFL